MLPAGQPLFIYKRCDGSQKLHQLTNKSSCPHNRFSHHTYLMCQLNEPPRQRLQVFRRDQVEELLHVDGVKLLNVAQVVVELVVICFGE